MAPESTENTQQAEKRRQNLRFWAIPPLGMSFFYISQGNHDASSIWAFRAFVVAFLLLLLAVGWKEVNIFARKVPIGLLATGMCFAYVGLAITISNIDQVSRNLFLLLSIGAMVAACLFLSGTSRQRTQFSADNTHQETPMQPQTKP